MNCTLSINGQQYANVLVNCVCKVKTAKNHLDIQHRLGLGKGRKGKYAGIG